MREQVVDVPPQEVITADNVVVSVDAVVYYEPTDPQRLIYNVGQLHPRRDEAGPDEPAQPDRRPATRPGAHFAATRSTPTSARSSTMPPTRGACRVKRVEMQRIDPPADVMSAMHEQMKAERTRRATVTTAEGAREADITVPRVSGRRRSCDAEAVKQQQILEAEGPASAVRTLAEAEKFRNIATAEGEAEAIRSVYGAIHDGNPTNDLLAIKYSRRARPRSPTAGRRRSSSRSTPTT